MNASKFLRKSFMISNEFSKEFNAAGKVKNVIEYLNSIGTDDNIIVIFHNDADGIASAALFSIFLKSHANREPYLISQPMPVDKNLMQKIKTTIPSKIVFLDLAIDQSRDLLEKISRIASVLIIDHHQISKNSNEKNIVHFNPRFGKPDVYQSNSYLTYKIFSEIMDMSSWLWIAGIGIIGDYDVSDSMDLINEIKKKYPSISIEPLLRSELGRIVDMISATRATKSLTPEQLVHLLIKAKNLEAFSKNREIMDSYEKIEMEIAGIMVDFEKSAERFPGIIFYDMTSEYNLRSPISTKVSEMHPDKLVVVHQTVGSRIKLSARNQTRRFDVSKLLQQACRGLGASAGGHANAAGAMLKKDDWEKFRERLIKSVRG